VKHNARVSSLDPVQIGAAVRATVEAFLRAVPGIIEPDFPSRMEKLAGNIALWGSKMNLTAHPDDPEEIAFHIIDSVMPVVLASDPACILHGQLGPDSKVLDLGSGTGFPGLVLAAASPANFVLIESRRKRASFLQVATAEMELKNAKVEVVRAEQIGPAEKYGLVTARAFGEPREFFALAAKALRPGGFAMLYANPSQTFGTNVERVPYSLTRKGAEFPRILAVCRQVVDS
jgi:16S rRNA (guanine(527)-N(7))-methyltransferase RsmG